MIDESLAYAEYLTHFNPKKRVQMPQFDRLAYTDNEYLLVVNELDADYGFLDGSDLTIKHLKGE